MIQGNVKAASMKTDQTQRHNYVWPPKESQDRHDFWLLMIAAYAPVYSNAKF